MQIIESFLGAGTLTMILLVTICWAFIWKLVADRQYKIEQQLKEIGLMIFVLNAKVDGKLTGDRHLSEK